MAAPTTVLTIIKDMTYRGQSGEEWSNTYALSGTTPSDSTAWRTLFDAVVVLEKALYTSGHHVIRGIGHNRIPQPGDGAVWSVDLRPSASTVAGTLNLGTGPKFAGDQAATLRWSLDRFNPSGKRVYLRKYFHGGGVAAGGLDDLESGYLAALNSFGATMRGGTVGGTRSIVDKLGNVPIAHAASPYVTTRTLKRRSKRATP